MFALITIICLILAGVCNAVMDTIVHHWNKSIFSKINSPKLAWWFGKDNGGSGNKYIDGDVNKGRVKMSILGFSFNKPVQICDAWHFFKMLMIIFYSIPASFVIYNQINNDCETFKRFGDSIKTLVFLWILLVVGYTINTAFNMFYDNILKK